MFGLLFYFLHVANFGITLSPSCKVRCPESAESLVLLPVLSALAPVAIMSRKETLLPGYYALKDSYLKLQRLLKKKKKKKQQTFLRSCIKKRVIPRGLSLRFNLAHRPTDSRL